MLALFLLAIAVFASPVARSCAEPANDYIFSLNSDNPYGGGWTVENSNGSIRAPAIVPGGIYSDLMRAGVIGDVYFKDNDVNTRWVSKMDWTFNRTFTVSSDILEKETVDIVFHGLDTIAYIIINDHPVAMTDNMFVRYKYNIKEYLLQGENAISVQFESPVLAAATLSDKEAVAPECVPEVYKGECHANQLRKMQASFSWDWGPALPSVGIWKAVNLEAYNSAVIRDIITETKLLNSEPAWELSLRVLLDAAHGADEVEGHLEADVALDNGVKIRTYEFLHQKVLQNRAVEKVLIIKISDANVKLWWPNGYGNQALYNVTVTFQSTQFVDEYYFKTIKVGFRTVELIQEQLSDGLSFYFKVNSYAMFMKGSNWIPAKILPENGDDKDTVDHLLQSAKDIHMNMLRVWGGGVYESDYFYQKCDELGILVWQDMMFACSMYPANSKYLSSVSEEIEQVIKRLQHHPSIAIWAGNNENEAALRDNWYGTANNFSAYKDGYISLYVDTIRPIVQRVDPTRTYVVSSPSNGLQSEADGYIAQNPGDSRFGDTHYYNYLQNLWSMDTFSKSRFCSEFGFQSIPSLATFLTATDDADDVKIGSAFMEHRQHSDFNNYASMALQIDMQFGALNEDDPNYFSVFQYYSQVIQAWAYKTESEFYRQSRFDWMTMGALYWQLNDVWQAPTWSGIEFGGAWKMLHYFGKDFFSPVLISPRQLASNEVVVRIISDRLERIENATITIDIFNWYNLTPLSTQTSQVNILPLSADRYGPNIILPPTEGRKQMFYRFSLRDSEANMLGPYNYIFPSALKDIQGYSAPNVTVQLVGGENPVHDLDVTTDGIGLFVWILVDRDVGWLSENGFVMSERTKRIQIHVPNQKNLSKLNNLKIQVYNQNHFAKKVEVKQVV